MTQLIIIRGNSGSGKTTLAGALRKKLKEISYSNKVAVVSQDVIRRRLLGEIGDINEIDNIDLIDINIKFCLERGYVTIVEGIFYAEKYQDRFQKIIDSVDNYSLYYLDIPFKETLQRHKTKPGGLEKNFGEERVKTWYREKDYLEIKNEIIISQDSSLEDSLALILNNIS